MTDDTEALKDRIKTLEARIAELETPEFWWPVHGYDEVYNNPREVIDDTDFTEVTECTTGRSISQKWIAWQCLSVDEDGDPDEVVAAVFDNAAAAKRCWPDSFASVNARGEE